MTWDDFWAFFKQCNDEMRMSLLEQINIRELIVGLSPKAQYDVLVHAPAYVINPLKSIIETPVKKRLGLPTIDALMKITRRL